MLLQYSHLFKYIQPRIFFASLCGLFNQYSHLCNSSPLFSSLLALNTSIISKAFSSFCILTYSSIHSQVLIIFPSLYRLFNQYFHHRYFHFCRLSTPIFLPYIVDNSSILSQVSQSLNPQLNIYHFITNTIVITNVIQNTSALIDLLSFLTQIFNVYCTELQLSF